MSKGVEFGKPLVGQVFNAYTDKFERGMSGFNRFIKDNMALFISPITFASVKLTNGKLWAPYAPSGTKSGATLTTTWTAASYGNNGAASDKVYAVTFNVINDLWYFAATTVLRSTGTIAIQVPVDDNYANFKVYIWAAKYSSTSPTLLEMISDSVFVQPS
jgi:hypothetical protein